MRYESALQPVPFRYTGSVQLVLGLLIQHRIIPLPINRRDSRLQSAAHIHTISSITALEHGQPPENVIAPETRPSHYNQREKHFENGFQISQANINVISLLAMLP